MEEKNRIISNVHQIRVRYADTDKMGYVYNGNYLSYFEVGRSELMRSYGYPYTELESLGYLLPLTEAHVSYKNPASYDDLLELKASLDYDKIGATIRFDYSITCKGLTIAEGYTVHSFMKADSHRPVKPPQIFLEKLRTILNIIQ